MSKPPKPLKRKSSKNEISEKSNKKSKASGEPLLTMKELGQTTGLSEFMLTVAMDLLDKTRPLTLIDIVCPNPDIRVLNQEALDASRHLCSTATKKKTDGATPEAKKKKVATDDEVRKFIVERREKALQSEGVRIAGSDLIEKMDNINKDSTLVSEFLGYARTSRNYFVYAYYVGPATPTGVAVATELGNPQNWLPVHKLHLGHFHRRIRDPKPYHKYTSYDHVESKLVGDTPLYDPRFMMHKWLAKDGQAHRALLDRHKPLLANEQDFLTKHYEEEGALYYYDESKADRLMIDLSMDVDVVAAEQDGGGSGGVFNAEQDRLRQQASGYRLSDKELCHVSITEFPSLSRIPLPREIDLSMEEFLGISQHTHVNERRLRPPEDFVCDPFVMTKAAIMALNFEAQIKRVLPLVGDAKLQILEADNVKPILDFMGNHKSCTDAIKEATFKSLLAFMAVEAMTREPPPHIKEALEKIGGGEELVLLDS